MPALTSPYRLTTLGGLALLHQGKPLGGAHAQPRRLALLALLARAGTLGISRDRLQALLWPESETERARHSLSQLVHLLRRELGEPSVQGDGTLRLDPARISSDLADFLQLLHDGDLEQAVARYAGPFLDGFHLTGSAEWDQWIETERTSLHARAMAALAVLADQAVKAGDRTRAIRWTERAWELDPLGPGTTVRLMEAMRAAGHIPAARLIAQRHEEMCRRADLEPDLAVLSLAAELTRRSTAEPGPGADTRAEPPEQPLQVVTVAPHQPQPRSVRRTIVPAATALALGAIATLFFVFSANRRSADPRGVLVAGFENRTNDPTLDAVGDMATDYIARGLAATRLVENVYDGRAEAPTLEARTQPDQVRALARRLGAGTVITGRYYRVGDSLHIEARLTDAETDRILLPLEPVAGRMADQTQVLELLRQRIMGGFSSVFGSRFEPWQAKSIPPTYETYREVLAGTDAIWIFEYDRAAEHFRRAALLDSSYPGARAALVYALSRAGRCSSADSVAQLLRPIWDRLPPFDRGQVELASGICRGDAESGLEASRAVLESAPRSFGFTVLTAVNEVELFQPHHAIATLARIDPRKTDLGPPQLSVYWSFLTYAYHLEQDYVGQLEAARAGLAMIPGNDHLLNEEVSALAALGRTAEARALAAKWLDQPQPEDGFSRGQMATCAALELAAHGSPEVAHELLEATLAWFEAHQKDPAEANQFPCVWQTLGVTYYAGRWDEARRQYQRLAASDSGSVNARAGLGALALRRGDDNEARSMERWLAERTSPEATLARARMAALRGDREAAVGLLRTAFARNLRGRIFLHVDPDFGALHSYPPYQQLLQLRD